MLLDSRLEMDSTFVTELELTQVRLHHNAAFPWIILVPRKDEVVEIIDLNFDDQLLLMREISLASQVMHHLFPETKLNVASLGNIVPQLHIHIIARDKDDKAWPGPVWNSGVNALYTASSKEKRISQIKATLQRFNA